MPVSMPSSPEPVRSLSTRSSERLTSWSNEDCALAMLMATMLSMSRPTSAITTITKRRRSRLIMPPSPPCGRGVRLRARGLRVWGSLSLHMG